MKTSITKISSGLRSSRAPFKLKGAWGSSEIVVTSIGRVAKVWVSRWQHVSGQCHTIGKLPMSLSGDEELLCCKNDDITHYHIALQCQCHKWIANPVNVVTGSTQHYITFFSLSLEGFQHKLMWNWMFKLAPAAPHHQLVGDLQQVLRPTVTPFSLTNIFHVLEEIGICLLVLVPSTNQYKLLVTPL